MWCKLDFENDFDPIMNGLFGGWYFSKKQFGKPTKTSFWKAINNNLPKENYQGYKPHKRKIPCNCFAKLTLRKL